MTGNMLEYKHYPAIKKTFILRDDLSLSFIDNSKKDIKKMLDWLFMSPAEKRKMMEQRNDHDSGFYDSSDVS